MSTNVITKKSPTTSTNSNTTYLSMMTPNVPNTNTTNQNTNNTNKRRESSTCEDSVSLIWTKKRNPRSFYLLYYLMKTP